MRKERGMLTKLGAISLLAGIAWMGSGCHDRGELPDTALTGPGGPGDGLIIPDAPEDHGAPVARRFGRIHYSDLTYLGAFKAPDDSQWGWAKGHLAWIPPRQSLVAVGQGFGEIRPARPVISRTEDEADLLEARSLGAMFNPLVGLYTVLDRAKTLGGMVWFQGRFWLGTYEDYNVAARDNLGISTVSENWSNHHGAWRVGPAGVHTPSRHTFHANKTHGDIMVIPSRWAQKYAPGRRLAGGRSRGAGAFGGGKGPALYAFEANRSKPHGGQLNGVPLMFFQETGHTWPNYHNADRYHPIWIWRGDRMALIVGARKGFGADVYGPGPSCTPAKGWQSDPYEPRMYFIDVNHLGEVAQGRRDPWSIRPYEEVMPDEMWNAPGDPTYDPGCKQDWMRSWAFDSASGLLYASQPRAYLTPLLSARMIVHVWQVN